MELAGRLLEIMRRTSFATNQIHFWYNNQLSYNDWRQSSRTMSAFVLTGPGGMKDLSPHRLARHHRTTDVGANDVRIHILAYCDLNNTRTTVNTRIGCYSQGRGCWCGTAKSRVGRNITLEFPRTVFEAPMCVEPLWQCGDTRKGHYRQLVAALGW